MQNRIGYSLLPLLTALLLAACLGVGEKELEEVVEKQKAAEKAKPKPAKKKKNLTLAQIKKKYGSVTRVLTVNGKEYIGYFKSDGGWMTIITPQGTVKVKQTKVKQIKPYP